mmetsp:Transcript_653/g.2181  ORF Transcript_653/g.2181 Transcript_653/m.2181 type:complete len:98 (+) Transcript_653:754-1047(+)
MDANGQVKRAGMLPIELERFQTAYYWRGYQLKAKGSTARNIEELDLFLIVHRKYPEPFCIFKLDTLDRVSQFVQVAGKVMPSYSAVFAVAKRLLGNK